MILRNFTRFHDQFLGFLYGGVKWIRNLIIGHDAPLKVIQDSIQLLGYAPFSHKANSSIFYRVWFFYVNVRLKGQPEKSKKGGMNENIKMNV